MATKNAAAESALGELHTLLATVMSAQLKNADLCTPALMSAVRAFLKDNEITCAADASNALGKLKENLAAAEAPGRAPVPSVTDKDNDDALNEVLNFAEYKNRVG
ncbi:terminase small subunit [Stenotrophomonas phage BUCT598]|uniref:Terminase small subunit n=1 Tax=Stenotrophomonas phage BUCT598 TaxID=2834253 RepID=A0A8F2F3S9_9CAUD|nr:terminase small subunit [Stenotrophomonas phage BUCT598]